MYLYHKCLCRFFVSMPSMRPAIFSGRKALQYAETARLHSGNYLPNSSQSPLLHYVVRILVKLALSPRKRLRCAWLKSPLSTLLPTLPLLASRFAAGLPKMTDTATLTVKNPSASGCWLTRRRRGQGESARGHRSDWLIVIF